MEQVAQSNSKFVSGRMWISLCRDSVEETHLASGWLGQTNPEAGSIPLIPWNWRVITQTLILNTSPSAVVQLILFSPITGGGLAPKPNSFSQCSKNSVQQLDLCEGYIISIDTKSKDKFGNGNLNMVTEVQTNSTIYSLLICLFLLDILV